MLNLRDILQLVVDRFDYRSFTEHDFIEHQHQPVLHLALEFGHKLHLLIIERLEQWL